MQMTLIRLIHSVLEDTTVLKEMLRQVLTKLDIQGVDIRDVQVTAMIHATKASCLGEPGNILQLRLSRHNRRSARRPINIDRVWRSSALKRWSTGSDFCLLLIQGSVPRRLELDAIGVHMARHIGQSKLPVLFALQQERASNSSQTTPEDIYRYLAMQALRLNEETLCGKVSDSFNSRKVESATTEQHWESIIAQALRGIREVYLVIELDLLERDTTGDIAQRMLLGLLRLASACRPTNLKIAMTSNKRVPRSSVPSSDTQVLDLDAVIRTSHRTPVHRNLTQSFVRRGRSRGGRGAANFQTRL